MRPKHRGVVRLKTQALWCRLDELNGSQNWLAEEIGISKSYMSFLIRKREGSFGTGEAKDDGGARPPRVR